MLEGKQIAVVIPAYNEAKFLGRVVGELPAYVDRVVVVDDGSDDGTCAALHDVPREQVEVLRHEANRGVGAAIVSGYARAFECGADIAVVVAADGQMHPEDMSPLLRPLLDGTADYSKGDRLSWPNAFRLMPLSRWLGNLVLSWLTRLCTGLHVRDSQCGYTALSRSAAAQLYLDQLWPRYGYPNDLLGQVARERLTVCDVIVRPVYADEASGVRLSDALLVIPWLLARALWRRGLNKLQRVLPTTALAEAGTGVRGAPEGSADPATINS